MASKTNGHTKLWAARFFVPWQVLIPLSNICLDNCPVIVLFLGHTTVCCNLPPIVVQTFHASIAWGKSTPGWEQAWSQSEGLLERSISAKNKVILLTGSAVPIAADGAIFWVCCATHHGAAWRTLQMHYLSCLCQIATLPDNPDILECF